MDDVVRVVSRAGGLCDVGDECESRMRGDNDCKKRSDLTMEREIPQIDRRHVDTQRIARLVRGGHPKRGVAARQGRARLNGPKNSMILTRFELARETHHGLARNLNVTP